MSTAELIEIRLLRLAAAAVDVRDQLTPRQIAETPALITVLEACDVLFEELGWGPLGPSENSNEARYFLN
jgi:hypothetical protein